MQIANQCQTQKQVCEPELEPKQTERTVENCLKGCSGPRNSVPLPMEKGHMEGASGCKPKPVRTSLSYNGGEKRGSPVISLMVCPLEHISSTPTESCKGGYNAKTLELLKVHSQRGNPCLLPAPPNSKFHFLAGIGKGKLSNLIKE